MRCWQSNDEECKNKMNYKVPKSFLDLSSGNGIDSTVAADFFCRKVAKKGIDDIKKQLVKAGKYKTESEAGKALLDLWKQYRESQQSAKSNYLDQARDGLERIIGPLYTPTPPKTENDRTAVISDLHIPFMNTEAFDAVMKDPASDLWILGDILDMYSVSSHRPTIDYILVREELAQARAVLEKLASKFTRIRILKSGNHDVRAVKKIQDLAPQILPLIVHPVDVLVRGLNNIEVLTTTIPNTAPSVAYGENVTLDYLGTVEDCLLGHFDNFCGADALSRLDDWLTTWSHLLQLEQDPRVILHGHTHRLSSLYSPTGKLLISTGCLCNAMPYQFVNHGKYQPPTIGYVALYRKNGETNLTQTEVIYIGH